MKTLDHVTMYVYRYSTAIQFAQLVWILNDVYRRHANEK